MHQNIILNLFNLSVKQLQCKENAHKAKVMKEYCNDVYVLDKIGV